MMTLGPEQPLYSQAGDYALGLLKGTEKQAFEAVLAVDEGLQAEVARCILHFEQVGIEREDSSAGGFSLLRREFWGENWMPWRRRIRIWEFALGGIAAALLAYASLHFGW